MPSTPHVIYAGRAELAEGPVWHEGALWWVDIVAGTLNRLDPETGVNTSRATGGFLGAATPCADGRWLLARQHDCTLFDWESGRFTPLAAPSEGISPRHRFNDGKCDPSGRFWVGTMSLDRASGEAGLFALEPHGAIRRALGGLSLANGLGWSPAGDLFYHIDSPTHRLSRFAFDPSVGEISERKLWVEFSDADGFPDGMTVDAAGDLWVALWSGSAVARIDGKTGRILEKHALPVSQVSSCTFGGSDLRTLFITTAWEGMSFAQREAQPLAGSLFALRTDTPGLPVTPFRIPSGRRL